MIRKRSIMTVVAAALSISAQAALVAQYDFSDGNLLNDSSGNGYDLVATGTVTTNVDGYSAQTVSGSFLKAAIVPATTFTVSGWFKPAAAGTTYASMFSSSQSDSDWQVDFANNNIRFNIRNGGADKNTGHPNLTADTWYHIAVVTDGSTSTLYLTPMGNALNQIHQVGDVCGLTDLRIGINRSEDTTWPGAYANVKVYDTALSEGEIETLLFEGPDGQGEPPEPPAVPTTVTYVWEEDMSTDPVLSDPAWVVRGGAGNYTVGGASFPWVLGHGVPCWIPQTSRINGRELSG